MKAMFYSVKEMSEILGITERSVYRSKEKLPGYIKLSGRCYFRKSTFLQSTLGNQEPAREEETLVEDKHLLL